MAKEKENSDNASSRIDWVDRYLLRYTPATILGSLFVAYFYSQRSALGISGSLDLEKHELTLLLGACGFLFCYIASAPILVYHVGRPLYLTRRVANKFDTVCSIVLVAVISVIAGVLSFKFDVNPLFATAAGVSISAWLLTAVLALWTYVRRDTIFAFYTQLAAVRSKDESGLVESYRTMREHGNAFYILLLEVVLASIVNLVIQLKLISDPATALGVSLGLLGFWLGPAAVAWYIAARLEIDFSGYNGKDPKPGPGIAAGKSGDKP